MAVASSPENYRTHWLQHKTFGWSVRQARMIMPVNHLKVANKQLPLFSCYYTRMDNYYGTTLYKDELWEERDLPCPRLVLHWEVRSQLLSETSCIRHQHWALVIISRFWLIEILDLCHIMLPFMPQHKQIHCFERTQSEQDCSKCICGILPPPDPGELAALAWF